MTKMFMMCVGMNRNSLANIYCNDITPCGSNVAFDNNVSIIWHFTRTFG